MMVTDVLRVALPIGGLALIIFAVGAMAGRAWPGPTWINIIAFAAWLMVLVASMLTAPITGLEWIWWLAPLSIVLSLIVLAKQIGARRGRGSSGG